MTYTNTSTTRHVPLTGSNATGPGPVLSYALGCKLPFNVTFIICYVVYNAVVLFKLRIILITAHLENLSVVIPYF